MYVPQEIVIHAQNWRDHFDPPAGHAKGLKPRNFSERPIGYCEAEKPFDLKLNGSYQDNLDLQIASKAQLSNVRMRGMNGAMIPSRDQNGKGYCWAHSTTSAAMILNARENQGYHDFSGYSVACPIKHFADEGGSCDESLDYIAKDGICTADVWAQQSMDRSLEHDPRVAANRKLHRFTEWLGLDPRNIKDQMIICLLSGIPLAGDFNWWSHSVNILDIVSLNPFKIRIWNSWGDGWSQHGMGIIEGDHAIPNNAVAPMSLSAAA